MEKNGTFVFYLSLRLKKNNLKVNRAFCTCIANKDKIGLSKDIFIVKKLKMRLLCLERRQRIN